MMTAVFAFGFALGAGLGVTFRWHAGYRAGRADQLRECCSRLKALARMN